MLEKMPNNGTRPLQVMPAGDARYICTPASYPLCIRAVEARGRVYANVTITAGKVPSQGS
jgi:hypothetical protein